MFTVNSHTDGIDTRMHFDTCGAAWVEFAREIESVGIRMETMNYYETLSVTTVVMGYMIDTPAYVEYARVTIA